MLSICGLVRAHILDSKWTIIKSSGIFLKSHLGSLWFKFPYLDWRKHYIFYILNIEHSYGNVCYCFCSWAMLVPNSNTNNIPETNPQKWNHSFPGSTDFTHHSNLSTASLLSLWCTLLGCGCLISTPSALHGPSLPGESMAHTCTQMCMQHPLDFTQRGPVVECWPVVIL